LLYADQIQKSLRACRYRCRNFQRITSDFFLGCPTFVTGLARVAYRWHPGLAVSRMAWGGALGMPFFQRLPSTARILVGIPVVIVLMTAAFLVSLLVQKMVLAL